MKTFARKIFFFFFLSLAWVFFPPGFTPKKIKNKNKHSNHHRRRKPTGFPSIRFLLFYSFTGEGEPRVGIPPIDLDLQPRPAPRQHDPAELIIGDDDAIQQHVRGGALDGAPRRLLPRPRRGHVDAHGAGAVDPLLGHGEDVAESGGAREGHGARVVVRVVRDHVPDDAMAVAGSGAEGGVGGGVAEGGAIGVGRAEDGGVESVEEEEGAGEDGGG